jgi:hypothetical protein
MLALVQIIAGEPDAPVRREETDLLQQAVDPAEAERLDAEAGRGIVAVDDHVLQVPVEIELGVGIGAELHAPLACSVLGGGENSVVLRGAVAGRAGFPDEIGSLENQIVECLADRRKELALVRDLGGIERCGELIDRVAKPECREHGGDLEHAAGVEFLGSAQTHERTGLVGFQGDENDRQLIDARQAGKVGIVLDGFQGSLEGVAELLVVLRQGIGEAGWEG